MLKGFGARHIHRHCWSGFANGASHSFPAAEQRVQAGQQFETAEAFRAGTVLSSKAGESKHQSKSVKAELVLGPLSSRSATSTFARLLERKLMLARLSCWLKNCPGCQLPSVACVKSDGLDKVKSK